MNYRTLGQELELLQVAMAESNNVFSDYRHMYDTLSRYYLNFYLDDISIQQINTELLKGNSPEMLKWDTFKYYIENRLDIKATRNEAELMRYFPEYTFLYYFLQGADYKIISKLRYLILEIVKTNFVFYVSYKVFDKYFYKDKHYGFQWRTLAPDFSITNINEDEFISQTTFTEDYNMKFRIRFISNVDLDLKNLIIGKSKITTQQKEALAKIVFHIHGGGFISMSSSSHQIYLRKFAKACNSCIFSIDYPLSPMSKFKLTTEIIFKAYIYVIVT